MAGIGAACAPAGIARPLLVTDRGLAALPAAARMRAAMEAAGPGTAVCAEVDPSPHEGSLEAHLAAWLGLGLAPRRHPTGAGGHGWAG